MLRFGCGLPSSKLTDLSTFGKLTMKWVSGCHFPGDGGVRTSVFVLQQRVVRGKTPALEAQRPPQRDLVRGQAGLVISKLSPGLVQHGEDLLPGRGIADEIRPSNSVALQTPKLQTLDPETSTINHES